MESKKLSKHHSITFYIPNKDLEFLTESIRQASVQVFGNQNKKNTVSKYLRYIIYNDLEKRNLIEKGNNPWEKQE